MVVISKALLKAALLITPSASLSGCVYDVGLGFASDVYYDDGYGCNPYGGYDAYYDCDYGRGFANIGYGGGYYDNYYYPGYGLLLFDNVGRRYPMRDHHRRYWGEKRQYYFRKHRSRDRDGRRYDGRPRGDSNDVRPGKIGRSEHVRKHDHASRKERVPRSDRWGSGEGNWHGAGSPVRQREHAQVTSRTENGRPIPQARERTQPLLAQPLRLRAPEGDTERPE